MVDEAVSLGHLRAEVDEMAAEEEVVGGCDGEGVAHEDTAVAAEGEGHAAGDAVRIHVRKEGWEGREKGWMIYISGSFEVSMTAAIGIPKLLAGPQKSVSRYACQLHSFTTRALPPSRTHVLSRGSR